MITEDMLPAFQGAIPSAIATINKEKDPNISYVSQVYYINETSVAISNQFFNKSIANIKLNGKAVVNITNPMNFKCWYLTLNFKESQTEGDLFENMSMQLESIASMMGMEDVFKLNSAEIFEVTKVEEVIVS